MAWSDLNRQLTQLTLATQQRRMQNKQLKQGRWDRLSGAITGGIDRLTDLMEGRREREFSASEAEKMRGFESEQNKLQREHDLELQKLRDAGYVYNDLLLKMPDGSYRSFSSRNIGEHQMNMQQFQVAWQQYLSRLSAGTGAGEEYQYEDPYEWAMQVRTAFWAKNQDMYIDEPGMQPFPDYEGFGGREQWWAEAKKRMEDDPLIEGAIMDFIKNSRYTMADYEWLRTLVIDSLMSEVVEPEEEEEEEKKGGRDRRRDTTSYFSSDPEEQKKIPVTPESSIQEKIGATMDYMYGPYTEEEAVGYPSWVKPREQDVYDAIKEVLNMNLGPMQSRVANEYRNKIREENPRRRELADILEDLKRMMGR